MAQLRPTQCVGELYLTVADSLAPQPVNDNNNNTFPFVNIIVLKVDEIYLNLCKVKTCFAEKIEFVKKSKVID